MKNLFKFGFLALAISLYTAGCGGSTKTSSSESEATTESDATFSADTTIKSTVDTVIRNETTPVQ